ncbi:MAG: hypothetical protein ABH856_01025 [Patescibacteria group bacterium]|nr:pilin [Patescibacteria group bacterium]
MKKFIVYTILSLQICLFVNGVAFAQEAGSQGYTDYESEQSYAPGSQEAAEKEWGDVGKGEQSTTSQSGVGSGTGSDSGSSKPKATPTPYESPIEKLDKRGTCYSELNPETIKKDIAAGKLITTEIEEGISPDTVGDKSVTIKTCFRVVASKADEDGKKSFMTFTNSKCETSGAQGTLESCKKMQLIISAGGTSLFYAYIGMIYKWVASIVGIIAVLIMIISGIQIAAAGGDASAVDDAKGRIFRSIGGLAILFLSGLILYTINPTFFVQ